MIAGGDPDNAMAFGKCAATRNVSTGYTSAAIHRLAGGVARRVARAGSPAIPRRASPPAKRRMAVTWRRSTNPVADGTSQRPQSATGVASYSLVVGEFQERAARRKNRHPPTGGWRSVVDARRLTPSQSRHIGFANPNSYYRNGGVGSPLSRVIMNMYAAGSISLLMLWILPSANMWFTTLP